MATKPKAETPQRRAAKTKRLRKGQGGRAIVPRSGQRLGGRAKNTPNVITRNAKEALELAFQGLGGVPALIKWGKDNKDEFYKIWARLIPKDVTVGASAGLEELLAQLAEKRSVPGDNARVIEGHIVNE